MAEEWKNVLRFCIVARNVHVVELIFEIKIVLGLNACFDIVLDFLLSSFSVYCISLGGEVKEHKVL